MRRIGLTNGSLFRIVAAQIFLVQLLFSGSVAAVDFSLSGHLRNRHHIFYNPDLDRGQSPETRIYSDIRFRLDPVIHVSEWIRIRSSFDVLDDYYGGSPHLSAPYSNPAVTTDPLFGSTSASVSESGPARDRSAAPATVSGVTPVDSRSPGAGRSYFLVRRVWAEITTPFAEVRVGRQPNHFGLGVVANSGAGVDSLLGDSADRILFHSRLGAYLIEAGYGKRLENFIDYPGDDYSEWVLQLGRFAGEKEESYFGFLFSAQTQSRSSPNPETERDRTTNLFIIDFYGRLATPVVNAQTEVALYSGKISDRDTLAVNGVVRLNRKIRQFYLMGEGGVSTGTSLSTRNKSELNTVPFNREYRVGHVLFAEALPSGNASGIQAVRGGAVSNAFYGRFQFDWDAVEWFTGGLYLLTAFAMQDPLLSTTTSTSKRFYGFEYGATGEFKPYRQVNAGVTVSHFFPGNLYEAVSPSHSALLAKFHVNVLF